MPVLNASKREIDIKIVYYGPGLCGKTTNLQCIHKKLAPEQRGEMLSLATKDDRTLFFDFLPIELGNVKGFKTRFHLYTVPGQVYYSLTRRAVLTAVDAVVFVADSQKDKMQENIESLADLEKNLNYYKKDLASLPFVIQYNKRDLKNILPVSEMNSVLNKLNVPFFEASAVNNQGVMETLTFCCKLVLKKINKSSSESKQTTQANAIQTDTKHPTFHSCPAENEKASSDEPIIKITNEELPPITTPEEEPLRHSSNIHTVAVNQKSEENLPSSTAMPDKKFFAAENYAEPPCPDPGEISLNLVQTTPEEMSHHTQPDNKEENVTGLKTHSLSAEEAIKAQIPPSSPSLVEIEGEPVTNFKVVACGQPKKYSDSSIKIPLIFEIGQLHQEFMVNITLKFDDFTLRER